MHSLGADNRRKRRNRVEAGESHDSSSEKGIPGRSRAREVAANAEKTVKKRKVEKKTKVQVVAERKSRNTDIKKSGYGRVLRKTQPYRGMPSTRKQPKKKKPPAAKGKLRNKKPGTSRGTRRLMPSRKSRRKPPKERPAAASEVDRDGGTELHRAAARKGERGRMRELLRLGFDPLARDAMGQTPLHRALWLGSPEGAGILVDAGGANNRRDRITGATPLHLAAKRGYDGMARKLLSSGVCPDVKDKSGRDPLYCALRSGHLNVVQVILLFYAWSDIEVDREWIKVFPEEMRLCTALLSEFEAEFCRMRESRVGDTKVSFHDVKERNARYLATLLPIESTRRVLRGHELWWKFPLYANIIARKLEVVQKRRALADRALRCFSLLPPEWSPLPWTFTSRLVTWLSDKDLRSWVAAADVRS